MNQSIPCLTIPKSENKVKILIVFMDFPGLLSRFQFSFLMLDPFDLTQKKVAVTLGHRKQLLGLAEQQGQQEEC